MLSDNGGLLHGTEGSLIELQRLLWREQSCPRLQRERLILRECLHIAFDLLLRARCLAPRREIVEQSCIWRRLRWIPRTPRVVD